MFRLRGLTVWGVVVLALGLIMFAGWVIVGHVYSVPTVTVTVGGTAFKARIADTEELRDKGLSGVESLGRSQGMLFVFDDSARHQMWMKDMNISLDIVWLNDDKEVVYVVRNLKPNTYPNTYGPVVPSRYVLEIPAGAAAASQITIGKTASFDLP